MEQELGTPPCGQAGVRAGGGSAQGHRTPEDGQTGGCGAAGQLLGLQTGSPAGWLTDRQLRGPTLTAAGEFAATAGLTGNYPVESWILITEAREWNR